MKRNTQKLLFALLLLSVNLFFCAQRTEASEMPTEEQIQQYQEDGSLQERIQYYENTGSDEVASALIQKHSQAGIATYNSLIPDSFLESKGLMPSEGNARILLLRVNFPDMDFDPTDTLEALQKIAFDPADENNQNYPYESLSAYYERASYGKLHVSGDVADYTAQHERSYYDNHIQSLFEEALDALDSQIDFSQYDGNQDGFIDGIYLHFAGPNTGWGTDWWSMAHHAFDTFSREYDGKKVAGYVTLKDPSNTKSGAQTLIHETGHLLGLPDYYSSTQIYSDGMQSYDMMFNNTGDFNGFSKWLLGWISEDEILKISLDDKDSISESVTLNSFSKSNNNDGYKLAVISPSDNGIFSEYLMIEYDTGVNNQSGLSFHQTALPDGFRVFHVNAILNDAGNDFAYANIRSTTQKSKFIETLDFDQDSFHYYDYSLDIDPRYTEVAGTSASIYHCNFINGDILNADTTPSTKLSADAGEKKADISITDFSPQGDTGTVTITMNPDIPSPDDLKITIGPIWGNIEQSNVIVLPVELSIDAALNPNVSPVLISDSGKEISGQLQQFIDPKHLYITIDTNYLEEGDYTLKLPEGTFDLGQNVGSAEQQLKLHVGKNMQLKSSGTISLGTGNVSCSGPNNEWYVLNTTDGTTAHLYKISSDGTLTDHTIDLNIWSEQFGYTPAMAPTQLLCLQDGTLVLACDYGTTYLLHLNENGELLDSVYTINDTGLTLHAINNTVKIAKKDTNGIYTRLWSTDFKSELKEMPIEYTNNQYIFLNNGYLILYLPNDLSFDSITDTYIDYRNENDDSVATYQIPYDKTRGILYPTSVLGGFETDSDFDFITLRGFSNSALKDGYLLTELTLDLNTIGKEKGEFLSKPIDYTFRCGRNQSEATVIQISDLSVQKDKVFFNLQNTYNSFGGFFTDTYCLNPASNTIDARISNSGYTPQTLSGNNLLSLSYGTDNIKYNIYGIATSEDPKDPEPPKDPETPKDPGNPKSDPETQKKSTDSKNTNMSDNQTINKTNTAKTGDSILLETSIVIIILSFAVIIGVVLKKRKN